ncbi:hypothetical protein HON22_02355 [Candidatus Peregrinibacteria bacterium]|jgi:hypothetical protein|nr:hypothetical protein [Candidatus Peregrinibacteria bacterium]
MLATIKSYWLKFAHTLGFINTKILLTLVFFLVITPIGLIMRLFGKDFLRKKMNKKIHSYWIQREEQPNDMRFQF